MTHALNNTSLSLPGMPSDSAFLAGNIDIQSQDISAQTEDMLRMRKEKKKEMKLMREIKNFKGRCLLVVSSKIKVVGMLPTV